VQFFICNLEVASSILAPGSRGPKLLSPLTYATWLLCGLGAVIFTSSARRTWQTPGLVVVALVLSAWLRRDTQIVGLLTAAVAVAMIVRPHWDWIAALGAGMLIGALDYSVWFQVFAAAGVVAAYLIPAPKRIIREEALAGLSILGLILALTPGVATGWQSAIALNVTQQTSSGNSVPNWVLLLAGSSILLGGLYQGIYRRR